MLFYFKYVIILVNFLFNIFCYEIGFTKLEYVEFRQEFRNEIKEHSLKMAEQLITVLLEHVEKSKQLNEIS